MNQSQAATMKELLGLCRCISRAVKKTHCTSKTNPTCELHVVLASPPKDRQEVDGVETCKIVTLKLSGSKPGHLQRAERHQCTCWELQRGQTGRVGEGRGGVLRLVCDEEVGNHHRDPRAPEGLRAGLGQHILPRWDICRQSPAAVPVRCWICLLEGGRQNGAAWSRDGCLLVSQPFFQTSPSLLAHQVEACLDAELCPPAGLMNFPSFFLSFQDIWKEFPPRQELSSRRDCGHSCPSVLPAWGAYCHPRKKDTVPDNRGAVISSYSAVAALSGSSSRCVDIFQNPLGVTEETAQSSFEPAGLLRSSAIAAYCGNTVSRPWITAQVFHFMSV